MPPDGLDETSRRLLRSAGYDVPDDPVDSGERSRPAAVRTASGGDYRRPSRRRKPLSFEDRLLASAARTDGGAFLVDGPHEH